MSDLIRIVDLEAWAHVGVPDEERAQAQKLLISLDLGVDSIAHAAHTDSLSRTVNYFDVAQHTKRYVSEHSRKLIETLAEELAADLLKSYAIKSVTLEIKKFILPDTQYVSVKITRPKSH